MDDSKKNSNLKTFLDCIGVVFQILCMIGVCMFFSFIGFALGMIITESNINKNNTISNSNSSIEEYEKNDDFVNIVFSFIKDDVNLSKDNPYIPLKNDKSSECAIEYTIFDTVGNEVVKSIEIKPDSEIFVDLYSILDNGTHILKVRVCSENWEYFQKPLMVTYEITVNVDKEI